MVNCGQFIYAKLKVIFSFAFSWNRISDENMKKFIFLHSLFLFHRQNCKL